MSGHSKFANIKHKKEKNDAAKGKVFTIIGREIAVAVKEGGPDPANNSKLAQMLSRRQRLTICRTIPLTVVLRRQPEMTEVLTTNTSHMKDTDRTELPSSWMHLPITRTVLQPMYVMHLPKAMVMLGTPGCVSFMFDKKGQIIIDKEEYDVRCR